MKFTVITPTLSLSPSYEVDTDNAVARVSDWRKEIGDSVLTGETIALLSVADQSIAVPSPVPGILTRRYAGSGEQVASGEPLALLSGVPVSLVGSAVKYRIPITPPVNPLVHDNSSEIYNFTLQERSLASHDVKSVTTAPPIYTVIQAEVSEAQRLAHSFGISLTPFVMHCLASSLTRFPRFNASVISESELQLHRGVHIACLQRTSEALFAPVIRNCERISLLSLARELSELRFASVAGTLSPSAMRGSTISFSEVSAPVLYQTGILRLPQAAILTLSDSSPGQTRITLCLTHDARAASPELAATFLDDIRRNLERCEFLFSG
jgi:hypothetical protein